MATGVFVVDALCKLARSKFGNQDAITPRFGTRVKEILGALSDLPDDHLRQARRIVGEWEKKGILGGARVPSFLEQPTDYFDPMNIPSPGADRDDEAEDNSVAAAATRDPRADPRSDPRHSRSMHKDDTAKQEAVPQRAAAPPAPALAAAEPGAAENQAAAPAAASNPSVGALLQMLKQTLAESQEKTAAVPTPAPQQVVFHAPPIQDPHRGYDQGASRSHAPDHIPQYPMHSPDKRTRAAYSSGPYDRNDDGGREGAPHEKRSRPSGRGSPVYGDYPTADTLPRRGSPQYDTYDNQRPPERTRPRRDAEPIVLGDTTGAPTPNELFKTKLCKSLTTGERCRFGDRCHFAHSESELRTLPPREERVNSRRQSDGPERFDAPPQSYYARSESEVRAPPVRDDHESSRRQSDGFERQSHYTPAPAAFSETPPAFVPPHQFPGQHQPPPSERPPPFPGQSLPPASFAPPAEADAVPTVAGERPRRTRFSNANANTGVASSQATPTDMLNGAQAVHDYHATQVPPTQNEQPMRPQPHKTRICKHFMEGRCSFGDRCTYVLPDNDWLFGVSLSDCRLGTGDCLQVCARGARIAVEKWPERCVERDAPEYK